ncbi:hypothetical protein MJD09_23760 [bacterium]|nr:hypothetical protein [bacterium]
MSKKNSWRVRIRKFGVVDFIARVFLKIDIEIPDENIKIVYDSGKKLVCFKFTGNQPQLVYHVDRSGETTQEKFWGYPIITDYKYEHINFNLVFHVLNDHWRDIKRNSPKKVVTDFLHGDLTHFNILVDNDDVQLIDQEKISNSVLFDHFYFYSYFLEALERNVVVSEIELRKIKDKLDDIYTKIFQREDSDFLLLALNKVILEDAMGLQGKEKYYQIFRSLISDFSGL